MLEHEIRKINIYLSIALQSYDINIKDFQTNHT